MKQSRFRSNLLHSSVSRALYAGILATALSLSAPAAWAQSTPVRFDIPAQPLTTALKAFADQSGMQLLYQPEAISNVMAHPLQGDLDRRQALEKLLEGSGLEVVYSGENAATVRRRVSVPVDGQKKSAQAAGQDIDPDSAASGDSPVANPAGKSAPSTLDTMVVTGTRIRGGATPSPVIVIGSEQMAEEGFADLGEVIRSIPQNFSGGQNPGVTSGAASGGGNTNYNFTGGSGMNLRGLGQDATLTLLNGRRMSYGGYAQTVDISAIPVDAVDRIEVVTDGASAVYGSDAVGGVANVILKRDFDGVTIGTRHGEATEGGLATHEYTATGGANWSTGGLIVTWKKASNDPINSGQRDYTRDMYDYNTLYQGGDLRAGLLSVHQLLGDFTELHVDALRTERAILREFGSSATYYDTPIETTTSLVSPGATFSLPNDWTLSVGAALGKDESGASFTVISRATGAGSDTSYRYENTSRMYEAGAEGPLFSLPAGDARLAVGAGYRYNDFLYYVSGSGVVADGDESSRFAYAELSLPIAAPDQDFAGVRRLELTGAIRSEDYDSYGRVTTPKIGLIYSPAADFTLKASWGKSFKAPSLYQRYVGQYSYLYPATSFGATGYASDASVLYRNGGNADLKPERARTWTASLAFHPERLPDLLMELAWFDIYYTERIANPIASSSQAMINSIYAEFVDGSPTDEKLAQAIASSQFSNFTGLPYDSSKVVAIVDNRYVNASQQRIKGIDLSGSYRFDLGTGRLSIRGAVSWLNSEQALTHASGYSDMAGILFYPARVNGRIGVVWSNGGLAASLFGNYKSGMRNTTDATKGASFTTFDTTLRYDTGTGESPVSDMTFELSAQNLLNRAPPLYAVTSLTNAPYDSTNYSAIGRFLGISISKHW